MRDNQQSLHVRGQGKWEGVLSAFGVAATILNRRKHHPCPWCGGKDRFRFTDQAGSGSFLCGQCGKKSPIDYLMHLKGWDFATAAREIEQILNDVRPTVRKENGDWALKQKRSLWNSSLPIEPGDFVDRYLGARAIHMKKFPPALRKALRMDHVTEDGAKSFHPGMIARVRSANGDDVNLHRTFLSEAGTKAPVLPARKMMVGTIPPGSAVRLYENLRDTLGIAEGIETALAASAIFRVPVWAALTSKLLETWEPPQGVGQVIIFGDNDPKYGGQAAALALAHRLAVKGGASIRVEIPPEIGSDWNDVLMRRSEAA